MRAGITLMIFAYVLLFVTAVNAQGVYSYRYQEDSSDDIKILSVDTTIFRLPPSLFTDSYADATQFYRPQGAYKRRGVNYYQANDIFSKPTLSEQMLTEPEALSRVSVYASDRNYNLGVKFAHGQLLKNGWSISNNTTIRTGRDRYVEGLFRNEFTHSAIINKRISDNHYITLSAEFDYSMRGLQFSASQECFSLTGNKYYNPTWGFYNGKVRNSRVNRDLSPKLNIYYQLPISKKSKLSTSFNINYKIEKSSRLGWYNAANPFPDYYQKMPSYIAAGYVHDYVTNIWRTNNTKYTQIDWSGLELANTLSRDGNAYYIVEDRVKHENNIRGDISYHTTISPLMTLHLGLKAEVESNRQFKVVRDLLGADYIMDNDYFMKDSYNASLELVNDLHNQDRKVQEGDRFGFDYTIRSQKLSAIARAEFRTTHLDFDIEAEIGNQTLHRIGHNEKERFPGVESYGRSPQLNFAPMNLKFAMGYAYRAVHYFGARCNIGNFTPVYNNIFLSADNAAFTTENPGCELVKSASLNYHYNTYRLSLYAEIFGLWSDGSTKITPFYDDLSRTMTRASIFDIGYRSLGIEVVADLNINRNWKLISTFTIGDYSHTNGAKVELYNDFDLQKVTSPSQVQIKGVKIGNTPNITSTLTTTYFGLKSYIFNLSTSYAGARYVAPSFIRRSERLLNQGAITESDRLAYLSQERLPDIFDFEISAMRFFWLWNDKQLYIRLAIRNLLGDNDRIYYATESDRIVRHNVNGYFVGSSPRESRYQYSSPRSFLLSISMKF